MASAVKLISTVIIFLLASANCYAGHRFNSQSGAKDYCVTVRNESGSVSSEKCAELRVSESALSKVGDYYLLKAGIQSGGATSMTSADTAVSTSYSLVRKAIASVANPGFDQGTLADGFQGQLLTILITEVGPGGTFTLTPTTKTGFNSLIFEAEGDLVTLLFVDATVGWIVITSSSVQMD